MQNETNTYDIARHELLTTGESRHVESRTEIGEVMIVQTIFGKARVRPVRRYHSARLWSSVAVAGVGMAAVALFLWKGIPQVPMPENAAAPAEAMVPVVPQPALAVSVETTPQPAVPVAHAPDTPMTQQAAPEAVTPEAESAKTKPMEGEPVKKAHEKRVVVVTNKPEASAVTGPGERQPEQKAAMQAPVSVGAPTAHADNTVQPARKIPAAASAEPVGGAVAQPTAPAASELKTEEGSTQP